MDWARASLPKSPRWHYRLVRTADEAKYVGYHVLPPQALDVVVSLLMRLINTLVGRERDRIGYQQFQILPYGDNFSDLAHFLNLLPHSRTLSSFLLARRESRRSSYSSLCAAAISIPHVVQAHSQKAKRYTLYHWYLPIPQARSPS
jgi:hypothetical protein